MHDEISMTEIQRLYKERNPDGHWFDEDTMKFFKTKLPAGGYRKGPDTLFATSECGPTNVRKWSVRRLKENGEIETVGEFNNLTQHEANVLINDLRYNRVSL